MALKTAEENAKIALRQLNRQTEMNLPTSDQGELETYIEEGFERIRERTSRGFDPKTHAPTLAVKAVRAYAKMEYSGLSRFEEQFERALSRWADQAAIEYNQTGLDVREYKTPADKYTSDIQRDAGDPNHPPYR